MISQATNAEDAVKDALDAAWELLEAPGEVDPDAPPDEVAKPVIATTLVACPSALADFEEFLDAAATVEHILDQAGARGVLQVATFHPAFQFEDAAPDDLTWTLGGVLTVAGRTPQRPPPKK